MRDALLRQLAAAQDRDADLKLLQDAIGIDSVTGNETGFASFLKAQMETLGLQTGSGDFLPGRLNVWGETIPDVMDAKRLMFLGHTDTVHVRGWEDNWQGAPQQSPFSGALIDGDIWGRGACDLKGGICAALAGLRLLQRAGYRPRGGLSFAFIGDEESGEPGTGVSAGAHDLVKRVRAGEIAKPDFAVYVEPTKLDVYTAQIGFFIADVTVTGKSAYFGTPELGTDALKATHAVLERIWEHEAELAAGLKHELVGASSILVTDIQGGGYIAVPGECRFSLIRKLRPGEDLDEAVRVLEGVLRAAPVADGITLKIDYTAGRDHKFGGSPVEIAPDDPDARQLSRCVSDVLDSGGALGGAPYWSEMPFLVNEIGCPTVYCAPGDIALAHTFEERIEVESYLAAVRAFALFVADYCGLEEAR
ncbi:M20 family metallopeptidase [Roseibium sediminicola]|uniref:M20/M25/M40 family metallo-hydrolase n=1 Tax=Roseibium sediminicola TaxID=2933272 RepID=A0ABT0GVZ2_9HYPH|nr:M20/M25/M40 family metallo-hydrolase [Roseibium sp. CAU 1639]MCK7613607.1 M20/M25/M40 family metallo-hydrolase [Roseibium sp. CAU 1639]